MSNRYKDTRCIILTLVEFPPCESVHEKILDHPRRPNFVEIQFAVSKL